MTKTVTDKSQHFLGARSHATRHNTSDLSEWVLLFPTPAITAGGCTFLMETRLLTHMSLMYTVELVCFPILTGDRVRTGFLIFFGLWNPLKRTSNRSQQPTGRTVGLRFQVKNWAKADIAFHEARMKALYLRVCHTLNPFPVTHSGLLAVSASGLLSC